MNDKLVKRVVGGERDLFKFLSLQLLYCIEDEFHLVHVDKWLTSRRQWCFVKVTGLHSCLDLGIAQIPSKISFLISVYSGLRIWPVALMWKLTVFLLQVTLLSLSKSSLVSALESLCSIKRSFDELPMLWGTVSQMRVFSSSSTHCIWYGP